MPDQIQLECTTLETLPANTQCFQLDNGSIFLFKSSAPQKLYVRAKGLVGPDADLPRDKIINVDAQGDAIHFATEFGAIFKATATVTNAVHVELVREMNSFESVEATAPLCTRVRDEAKQVYRLGDSPDENCVIDSRYNAAGGMLKAIHRNKLIIVRCRSLQFAMKTKSVHRIRELNRTALAIELPLDFGACRVYACDSSPIIYVSKMNYLFAFNTETLASQPMMCISGITNISIVGVTDGVITLTGKCDGTSCLVTAPLPDAEFKIRDILDGAQGDYYTSMESKMSEFLSKQPSILRREVDYSYCKKPEYYNTATWKESKHLELWGIESKRAKVWECYSDDDDVYTKSRHASKSFREKVLAHPEHEWQHEYGGMMNELLDKNAELEKQIERQRNHKVENHHSINHFNITNNELEETNMQLENDNRYANINLHQKQRENDEIEAASNQLSEEQELLIKKVETNEKSMTDQIRQLREVNARLTLEREQLTNNNKLGNVSVSVVKQDLVDKREMLMKENSRLVISLSARKSQDYDKKILEENEQKMKLINWN